MKKMKIYRVRAYNEQDKTWHAQGVYKTRGEAKKKADAITSVPTKISKEDL